MKCGKCCGGGGKDEIEGFGNEAGAGGREPEVEMVDDNDCDSNLDWEEE